MNEQHVTVTFNPANPGPRVTFSTDQAIEFAIDPVQSGTVVFNLEVRTALEVNFPSNPIQWIDSAGVPIDPPGVATVNRLGPGSASVSVKGSPETVTYTFFVIVQTTDGRFFGSDPTIVTMRPPGGDTSG